MGETAYQYPGFDWTAFWLLSLLTVCKVIGKPCRGHRLTSSGYSDQNKRVQKIKGNKRVLFLLPKREQKSSLKTLEQNFPDTSLARVGLNAQLAKENR